MMQGAARVTGAPRERRSLSNLKLRIEIADQWSMRRLRVPAMVLALLVCGCGSEGAGGIPESEQVRSVVRRYFSAFARSSGTELCPLLTQSAQNKMVEVVESDERELGRSSTAPGCPEAVKFFGGGAVFKNVKVIAVSITGTTATVTVKVGSFHSGRVALSKTAAGWLINQLPGQT
jgi:hypothetical protein